MDTKHTLTNHSYAYTTNVNLGAPETLMKMFLSAARKQTDVALRHELKDQMMDVTLYEEPCKGV